MDIIDLNLPDPHLSGKQDWGRTFHSQDLPTYTNRKCGSFKLGHQPNVVQGLKGSPHSLGNPATHLSYTLAGVRSTAETTSPLEGAPSLGLGHPWTWAPCLGLGGKAVLGIHMFCLCPHISRCAMAP